MSADVTGSGDNVWPQECSLEEKWKDKKKLQHEKHIICSI